MVLQIYQIVILISIGALVGISISFIGQTGLGIVLPIILLFTGDVFLAIAINLLNDLITSATVSIGYLRKKQFKIRSDSEPRPRYTLHRIDVHHQNREIYYLD